MRLLPERLSPSNVLARLDRKIFGPPGRTARIRSRQGFASEILPLVAPVSLWPLLTKLAYARNDIFSMEEQNRELFDWEERVVVRHFPSPGKLLVAACGGGREMAAMAEKGWNVAGFDPVAAFVEAAHRTIPTTQKLALEQADFSQFAARLDSLEANAPYDAFIFGWGSFSHVYTDVQRLRLMEQARRLCPKGPVVASWVSAPELWEERRVWRDKFQCFPWVEKDSRDVYDPSLGMIHDYPEDEIARLTARTGQRIAEFSRRPFERYVVWFPG